MVRGDEVAIAFARDARGDLAAMTAACAGPRGEGLLTSLLSQLAVRPTALTVYGAVDDVEALRRQGQRFGIAPEVE